MSEYWKSTPKYWCKHCETYVRDTKLERQNHESTAKHQGALKRFLRDLHRNHEREEREKDRAKREVERLNGVVGASSAAAGPSSRPAPRAQQSAPTEASLKKQREQLAAMGVAMPSDFRPEMAMPGEWTPRRWGRDSKVMPQQEDQELDALLSGSTFTPRAMKEETEDTTDVKKEDDATPDTTVKTEDATEVKTEDNTDVKTEAPAEPLIKPEPEEAEPGVQTVVFKKRKPKGIRQK
ncbi:hypothetical protein AU210_004616 [Fusarium oxysporum f. sp. radicis-cucumerinum]|uniref:U1-type domain-containing protein n=1 Tax=Fusarium oxysporum f. sp. radicis-cucumerinum TaxID=327505 RepID=A0A2H3HGQ7_FUSOX|nr:hypothetical protein AU210_004616 [Fusarium oxysporum f. sp. radicis-cucumerinum]